MRLLLHFNSQHTRTQLKQYTTPAVHYSCSIPELPLLMRFIVCLVCCFTTYANSANSTLFLKHTLALSLLFNVSQHTLRIQLMLQYYYTVQYDVSLTEYLISNSTSPFDLEVGGSKNHVSHRAGVCCKLSTVCVQPKATGGCDGSSDWH